MTQHVAIVPDEIDLDQPARYLRLPHPRTGQPQLYLPLPSGQGLCEVARLSGARGRTWFIGDDKVDHGSMLLHVPVDPLFVVIPLALHLLPADGPGPFQPLADLVSTLAGSPAFVPPVPAGAAPSPQPDHNPDVARLLALPCARRAFRACCERKAAPDAPTTYYRPSRDAILALARKKVAHFARPEHYETFDHLVRGLARDGLLGAGADAGLVEQARTKAALEHLAQYLPLPALAQLTASYDLSALQAHLADRAAASAASAPAVKSDAKAGAKRKAPPTSRGVEQLKKVNTGGMSKLTSFFKKK